MTHRLLKRPIAALPLKAPLKPRSLHQTSCSLFKRRCVIYAITSHSSQVASFLQHLYDLVFVFWEKETCKMLALGTKVYNSDKLIHGGLSGAMASDLVDHQS
jgi:hypothetical protein